MGPSHDPMLPYLVDLESTYESTDKRPYDAVDLVRFALTVSDYWAGLGLGWLEQGVPTSGLDHELLALELNDRRPQALRHRARRIRKGLQDVPAHVHEEVLYALVTRLPDGTWFASSQILTGEILCGPFDAPVPDDPDDTRSRYEAMLRDQFGVDEPIPWERTDDGWGANLKGSARLPEHEALIAAARPRDCRFVRALGARSKRVAETGAVDAKELATTMSRRARRLAERGVTIGPVDAYLDDLARAAANHDQLVHVVCVVTQPKATTVHSAALTADRTAILASLDHVLRSDIASGADLWEDEPGVGA